MKEKPVNNLGEMLRAKLVQTKKTFAQEKLDYEIAMQRAQMEVSMRQAALQNNIYTAMNQAAMQNNIYVAQPPEDPFDPNNEPAYQMTLSALSDLWAAKHGDKWVNFAHDDQFWIDAVERLGSAGKLETKRGWMRLKD